MRNTPKTAFPKLAEAASIKATTETADQPVPSVEAHVALVTGGARGLGLIVAEALVSTGWRVGLIGRDAAALAQAQEYLETVAHLSQAPGAGQHEQVSANKRPPVSTAVADVTDYSALDQAVEEICLALGEPTLLVNNAGVIDPVETPPWQADPQDWRQVIEVDLIGAFNAVRATVPRMLKQPVRPVRVINLSSGAALRDSGVNSAYHAAKTGLARLTGSVHAAGVQDQILAFDFSPGVVRTGMTASMAMHRDRTEWTPPTEVAELALRIAMGELDAWSGRHLRTGTDLPATLPTKPPSPHARTLRLFPYASNDPLRPA